jgi:hypothetical protein
MKVVEYLPLYGLIRNCDRIITFNELTVPVKDLFTNYPELELEASQIDQLDTFDCSSLQNVLQQIHVSNEIITSCLKNLLENYINEGGSTEHWVRQTFRSVDNYNTNLRSIIESYLANMSYFVSYPSPVQSHKKPATHPVSKIVATTQPVYDNLLDAFNSAVEYNRVMAILHEKGYCTINGTWKDYTSAWMAVQTKIIKCLIMQGYCKKTIFSPSEIQTICMNTFKTDKISRSTITHNHATLHDYSNIFKKIK